MDEDKYMYRRSKIFSFQNRGFRYKSAGFTLVELLVVIAIISILAAIMTLVINPIELIKQSRDTTRISDLGSMVNAISIAVQESSDTPVKTYCKPPEDTNLPCTGTSTGSRAVDGTGWVKVDFTKQKNVTIATLPIDPVNTGENVYTYKANGDGYKFTTKLESNKQKDKMKSDGGPDDTLYEVGTNLTL